MTSDSPREEPDPRRPVDEPRFGFKRVRVVRRALEEPARVWIGDKMIETTEAIEIDLDGDVHFGELEYVDSFQPTLLVGTQRLDRFYRTDGGIRFVVYPEVDEVRALEVGAPIRFAPTAAGPVTETGLTLGRENEDDAASPD